MSAGSGTHPIREKNKRVSDPEKNDDVQGKDSRLSCTKVMHVIVINAIAPIDIVKNKLFDPSQFE